MDCGKCGKYLRGMECQPIPISKPSRLTRREKNVTARAAIDICNTTEETVNINQTNPVPVEENKSAENTEKVNSIRSVEISITT